MEHDDASDSEVEEAQESMEGRKIPRAWELLRAIREQEILEPDGSLLAAKGKRIPADKVETLIMDVVDTGESPMASKNADWNLFKKVLGEANIPIRRATQKSKHQSTTRSQIPAAHPKERKSRAQSRSITRVKVKRSATKRPATKFAIAGNRGQWQS